MSPVARASKTSGLSGSSPRKAWASLALCGALAALAVGCMGDDQEGDGKTSLRTETQVLATTPPTDEAPGTIVTHEVEYECWDEELETYEYDDTTYYAIGDGSMLLWSAGDCLAAKLSGSSTTAIGTWTTNNLLPTDSVPAAYRDPDCDEVDDDVDVEFEPLFEDMSVTYTITASSIQGQVTGTFCYGPLFALAFEENPFVEVESSGCSEVRVTSAMEEGKSATFSLKHKGEDLVTKFSYAGKSCSMTTSLGLDGEPPVCAEEYAAQEAFDDCVLASGFYPDFEEDVTAKKAATESPAGAVRSAIKKASARLP